MNTIDVFEEMTAQEFVAVEGGGWVRCGLGTAGEALTGEVAGGAATFCYK